MTEKEIRKRVYEKYPVTEKELTCHTEKMFRDKMRQEYREKIIDKNRNIQTPSKNELL